jgi:hypothetical protein
MALQQLEAAGLIPCHLANDDPRHSSAISKVVIERQPSIYIPYKHAAEYTIPKNKQNVVTENLNDDSFSDSCSSQEENQTLSKRDALDYLK